MTKKTLQTATDLHNKICAIYEEIKSVEYLISSNGLHAVVSCETGLISFLKISDPCKVKDLLLKHKEEVELKLSELEKQLSEL